MWAVLESVLARRPGSPASPAASWESEEINAMRVTRAWAQASYVGVLRGAGPPATGVAGAVGVEKPPATGVGGAVRVLGGELEPFIPCQAPLKVEMMASWVPGDAVGDPEGSLCSSCFMLSWTQGE